MAKPINVVIKGEYTDRDINRAIRDLERLKSQSAVTGGALGTFQKGMVAAGGALAAAFSFDAVINAMKDAAQAAMQDEKSMVALATAMDNVGLASQNAQAEGLIESMMLQTGIADDALRPAYQKLVTVTKDVTEAQSLLQTALDLSAAGYGELTSVSKALSAAANGNFTALQRLKVPIDQAALASKDFDAAVESLNRTVGGQAAAAAETYAGQMARLNVAVGEAQEAIGYALLNSINSVITRMGGVGGLQDTIIKTGDDIAILIDGVTSLYDAFNDLTSPLQSVLNLSGGFGGRQGKSLVDWAKDVLSNLGPVGRTVATLITSLQVLGLQSDYAADASRGLTSATVQAAIASGKASTQVAGLSDDVEDAGNKAWYATQSYLAFFEALVQSQRAARDFANTSGTVSSALREGAELGGSPVWEQLRQKYGELAESTRSAGSSGSKAAEDLAIKWKQAAAEISADIDGLRLSFGGGGTVIAGGMVEAFQSRLDAFRSIINTQVGIVKQATDALDSYAKAVSDTVLGNIQFSMTGAEGQPLTPEQVVQMVLGDIEQQGKAVQAISQIATKIPEALAQQILTLPPDAAIGLANYLANNPAQLEQLNTNYQALALTTQTLLGIPMAEAFAVVGDQSAVSMIQSAKEKIAEESEAFRRWVQSKLKTRITVEVEYRAVNVVAGASLVPRAEGGPVGPGTAYLVGEQGPEVFVPKQPGVIVPNDAISGGGSPVGTGGSTFVVNISAGIGDPRAIGREVVEAITLYERASGPVFARA
jgi:hypothetical protein